jgi:hypothetical protein
MIKVNKKINLYQLDQEYNGQGLIASLDEAGEIWQIGLADNNQGNETELAEFITNHLAQFVVPTIQEKLQSIGVSLDDLKNALGII